MRLVCKPMTFSAKADGVILVLKGQYTRSIPWIVRREKIPFLEIKRTCRNYRNDNGK